MSLLLSLSSKSSLPKFALRSHTLRMFSSMQTTTNPYLMYRVTSSGEEFPKAGAMTELQILDPAKEETLSVLNKPLPDEMVQSRMVGSSQGWGVFLTSPCSILISDYCNPSSSETSPKIIPLHPRTRINSSQIEIVTSVAISSSPEEEEDFVMAVKYLGRLVNIFTPGRDNKGNLLYTSTQLFDYFEQSKLMYSKKDQRFCMISAGGHHLWSWDGLQSTFPRMHELRFQNLPQFSDSVLQLLDSCNRTDHLVESPSGQRFLVKWYSQSLPIKEIKFECGGTKRFMVFREEEGMKMCYTEDIGDLCIFIGNNEPFCVKASSFPGLSPNSIYFLGDQGYGVYDIATITPRSFNPKSISAFSNLPLGIRHWVPHWVPPFPL